MIENSKQNPQFTDSNGTPVFVGDKIFIEEVANASMRIFRNKIAVLDFSNEKGKFTFKFEDEKPMQFTYDFTSIKTFRKL